MKRRQFLKYSSAGILSTFGAAGLLNWTPRSHAAELTGTLYITSGTIKQSDGTPVYSRGFSSSADSLEVPGPSFIVQQDDMVSLTIHNTLNTPHSFSIHGLLRPTDIPPGTSKTIRFTASSPGSYLYLDNSLPPYNRLLGLHGGFAVMPKNSSDELYTGSPRFKQQLFWILNEIDPSWNARLQNGSIPDSRFTPRHFTVNGLSLRPPGAPGYGDPAQDAGYDKRSKLEGAVGDRTLVRILNAGLCIHSLHWHGNHVEWLTENGSPRSQVWKKDTVRLDNQLGRIDVIYPFDPPPDANPPVTTGKYVMHLHDEMTQTSGGGLYQFGAATLINFIQT